MFLGDDCNDPGADDEIISPLRSCSGGVTETDTLLFVSSSSVAKLNEIEAADGGT